MSGRVFYIQGIYYVITGVWPFLHLSSFIGVTGYKYDIWLVYMVGLLAAAIGITLLMETKMGRRPVTLSVAVALAFFAIEVYFVLTGSIRSIYLADAVAELIFMTWILLAYLDQRRSRPV